jgi:hypothetical protein
VTFGLPNSESSVCKFYPRLRTHIYLNKVLIFFLCLSSSLPSKHVKSKIYITVILPVFLYGCETWSFTFRGERRLRVFENRALRKIFGPKRNEVTG